MKFLKFRLEVTAIFRIRLRDRTRRIALNDLTAINYPETDVETLGISLRLQQFLRR